MEQWERRAAKLRKRREGMQVSGISLKKVLLPAIRKRAEELEKAKDRRKARNERKG